MAFLQHSGIVRLPDLDGQPGLDGQPAGKNDWQAFEVSTGAMEPPVHDVPYGGLSAVDKQRVLIEEVVALYQGQQEGERDAEAD